MWEEIGRSGGTHHLDMAENGTGQDTERQRATVGHSQTGDGKRRGKSVHGKKATEYSGGTHELLTKRRTSQDRTKRTE